MCCLLLGATLASLNKVRLRILKSAITLQNKLFEPETGKQSSDVCQPFEIALLVTVCYELQDLYIVININIYDRKYLSSRKTMQL